MSCRLSVAAADIFVRELTSVFVRTIRLLLRATQLTRLSSPNCTARLLTHSSSSLLNEVIVVWFCRQSSPYYTRISCKFFFLRRIKTAWLSRRASQRMYQVWEANHTSKTEKKKQNLRRIVSCPADWGGGYSAPPV